MFPFCWKYLEIKERHTLSSGFSVFISVSFFNNVFYSNNITIHTNVTYYTYNINVTKLTKPFLSAAVKISMLEYLKGPLTYPFEPLLRKIHYHIINLVIFS